MSLTVVRARTAADLLALVPALVGMPPHESLVLVVFRRARTMGALRLDLPPASAAAELAGPAVGMVCRLDGADAVVPVVYTDRPFHEALPDARRLLEPLSVAARRAGLAVKDALLAAADGYGSLHDPALPEGGRPLADLREPAGLPPLLDVDAEATLADVPDEARRRFLARVRRCADGTGRSGRTLEGVLTRADPVGAVERALDLEGAEPRCVPLLAALAERPALRDLVLLQIGWGPVFGTVVFDRTVLGLGGPLGPEDDVALAFSGGDMPRPDPARIERAIEMLRCTAAHLPEQHRAPLLTMLAWLHWSLGRGTIAGRLVDAAARIDPEYGLADLLARMLGAGMLPEWAYRPEPIGPVGRAWAFRLGRRAAPEEAGPTP